MSPESEEMEGKRDHCQHLSSHLHILLAATISELYCGWEGCAATPSDLEGMFLSRISDNVEFSRTASSVAVCAGHKQRGEARMSVWSSKHWTYSKGGKWWVNGRRLWWRETWAVITVWLDRLALLANISALSYARTINISCKHSLVHGMWEQTYITQSTKSEDSQKRVDVTFACKIKPRLDSSMGRAHSLRISKHQLETMHPSTVM